MGSLLQLNHRFSEIELPYWPFLFGSPYCKVERATNSSYILTACRVEKLDHNEVFESAERLKTMMQALAKIELGVDFANLEPDDKENAISSIRRRLGNTCDNFTHLAAGRCVASANPVEVEIKDEYGNIVSHPRQEHWYDYFLDQCEDRVDKTAVFKALSYFAQKT
jgi:hypothetical protein